MDDPTQQQGDPLAETHGAAEPDPFAEVESGAPPIGEGPIPVREGALGGDNPSQEGGQVEEPAAEAEPTVEEPAPGEYMEEPPEAEEAPVAEEEPQSDALGDGDVLGEGSDDLPPPIEAPPVEEPPAPESEVPLGEPEAEAEAPIEEPQEEVATPVGGSESPPSGDFPGSGETSEPEAEPVAEPVEEDPPQAEAEPEPAKDDKPEAEKTKPKKRRKRRQQKKAGHRPYVVLARTGAELPGSDLMVGWDEAFRREEDAPDEPITIEARGTEQALRAAYRKLTDNGEDDCELVAIPAKLFRPKKVVGKVPENALTIKVS